MHLSNSNIQTSIHYLFLWKRKMDISRLNELQNQVTKRAAKFNQEKRESCKNKNRDKEIKCNAIKQLAIQNECRFNNSMQSVQREEFHTNVFINTLK